MDGYEDIMPTWCTRIKQPTRLLPLKIIKKEKACVRDFKLIFICLVYKASKYIQHNWSRSNCFTNEKASDRVNKLEIVWIYKEAEDGDGVGMWAMPYFSTVQIERYIFRRLFSGKCFWSRTHIDAWQKEFPTMSIYMIEIDIEMSTPLLRTPIRRL